MEQNQLRETQNSPITDAESVCDSKNDFGKSILREEFA